MKTPTLSLALALGCAIPAVAQDSTINPHCQPEMDLSDPSSMLTEPLSTAPPDWVRDRPTWQIGLITDFRELRSAQNVIAAGDCSCEIRNLTHDELRDEIEAFLEPLGDIPERDLTSEEYRVRQNIGRQLRAERRALRPQFDEVCREAE
ncbi:hypothetical protein V8J82_22450 [Gymnodinialimonas sp. 2305UL16-5]|uniref:hypothetical protein n=1 Tax=Gymnodinialimonas mytili TaxID=3126503 RepID=UPI0030B5BE1F